MKRVTLRLLSLGMLAAFVLTAGCSTQTAGERDRDPHSFANPDEVVTKHVDLDLRVDFGEKRLIGKVRLTVENKTGTKELVLDTRDLDIQKVTLGEQETETTFELGEAVEYLGQPLRIAITPDTKLVTVYYSTSPKAAALQWLAPEQTAGGKHPFLFTQSEAILARTWIPCQDSPGIRVTYRARIQTDPELMAVMSAKNGTTKTRDGVYTFEMPQPIPSYLFALAVGDLAFRPLGPRSGVYAEPSVVDKAAWEFADTEKMIAAAEELYGPYRWGRYDILVLPPSFPFGGMENPRLTFATPTVLAGDRSLVALIAHELAHSWSGNLVTNANWNDFWLNEGFTTYFEHRIMEKLYGKDYEEMLAQLSYESLEHDLHDLGPSSADTHLHLNLKGRDPDEGMTAIAYDKGHYFLRTMEHLVGRERWDAFLRSYFDKFAFQSMTSDRFVDYLKNQLIKGDEALAQKLKVEDWVYGPGIPDNVVTVRSREFEKVEAQLSAWQKGTPAVKLQTKNWTTHHWLHFLNKLPDKLTLAQMQDLDRAFHFTKTHNSEILCAWLQHAIVSQYKPAYPALETFLTHVGRRKFLKPLYARLAETPEGLAMARRIYRKARPLYHSIATGTLDEILGWQSGS